MRHGSALLLLAVSQAACVVPAGRAPGPGRVDESTVKDLKSGFLTRAETLMRLGEPDLRYLDDRVFAYRWTETLAIVLVAGGYQAGGFDISEQRRLMIEFDAGGATRRVEVIGAVRSSTLDKAVQAWLAQVADPAR